MDRRGWVAAVVGGVLVLATCCVILCIGGFLLFGGRYMPCVPGRPADVTVQDLAGRYRTAGGGELVLEASGTFTSQGIEIEFDNRVRTLSGPGRWELRPPGEDTFGDIDLHFYDSRFGTYLDISGTRAGPWLYWYIGDPDLCRIERFDRV